MTGPYREQATPPACKHRWYRRYRIMHALFDWSCRDCGHTAGFWMSYWLDVRSMFTREGEQ